MLSCFNQKSKKIKPHTAKNGDKIIIYENKKKVSSVIVGNPESVKTNIR